MGFVIVEHQRTSTVTLTSVPPTIGITRAKKHFGDGLKVGVVAIVVLPNWERHAPKFGHLLASIIGGAPSQGHGKFVDEGFRPLAVT